MRLAWCHKGESIGRIHCFLRGRKKRAKTEKHFKRRGRGPRAWGRPWGAISGLWGRKVAWLQLEGHALCVVFGRLTIRLYFVSPRPSPFEDKKCAAWPPPLSTLPLAGPPTPRQGAVLTRGWAAQALGEVHEALGQVRLDVRARRRRDARVSGCGCGTVAARGFRRPFCFFAFAFAAPSRSSHVVPLECYDNGPR